MKNIDCFLQTGRVNGLEILCNLALCNDDLSENHTFLAMFFYVRKEVMRG